MKKFALLLILIIAVLLMAACGSEKHEPTVVVETPAPAVETAMPEKTPEVQAATPEPEPAETAQPEDTGADEEKYQIALGLVGETVEELYDAIGWPEYSDYGPSCLGEPGSEDGQLDYDGFSVFTLVENGVETIVDVLKDGEF